MSLKDIVDGIGHSVEGLKPGQPDSPDELRRPVLGSIDLAERQWANASVAGQASWFSEDRGTVAFSPTLANGAPLTIDGQTTVFIPADRFADYLVEMRKAVNAGVFDQEIASGLTGSPNVSGLAKVPMPPAREGESADIRRFQHEELLARERGEDRPDRV